MKGWVLFLCMSFCLLSANNISAQVDNIKLADFKRQLDSVQKRNDSLISASNITAKITVSPITSTGTVASKADPGLFLCFGDLSDDSRKCTTPGTCLEIPSRFNFNIAKNCYFCNTKNGKAVTPKYITIIDQRFGTVDYLKLKNEKGYEYVNVKKYINPKANFEMYVGVIAKDNGYNVKVESEDYYKEYEQSFAKALQDANPTAKAAAAGSSATGSTSATETMPPVDKNTTITPLFLAESLDLALVKLVGKFGDQAIIAEQYFNELNCLRTKIAGYFGSYRLADSAVMSEFIKETESMIKQVTAKVSESLPKEKAGLIQQIHDRYLLFLSRQLTAYHFFGTQIQIPDKDVMKFILTQTAGGTTKDILARDFRISGGFKIDFSAGIFVSGLYTPEFVAGDHKFRYQFANFVFNTTTNKVDTVYTGKIVDTIGKMIHTKNPVMNYSAGFLAHAYMRTGQFANAAFTTGLLLNGESIKVLVGGSLMLGAVKSRISLSGGLVIGNQRMISPVVEQAIWNDTYKEGTIYKTVNDVPKFILEADVPYFMKWKTSWFFGITYNFGSVSIHW